ncbi:ATP synthase F1 subunit gamma [Buchnera aphidicola]|uniref:ATP synthase gamma chain n=1 Tax=Buchnera aphidicola (Sarucallis kahawaluokalani) TaxID=1241878 RepID=A0A4D6Y8Z4_9GAMM|nr:ATP synthase F1 subunit gamma [Buchnera aphidicola]QCI25819.1 ATP synthase F1 subunit gamma [Buchnera aphidicola (Sarucallis kahawaluokalani)]
MANTKIIRDKIISIKNTQKITKTMEMIAISKMKKVKQKISISASYLYGIKKIISHTFDSTLKYQCNFLYERSKVNTVNIIILSSNRGLCGNLNYNVFKKAISLIQKYNKKDVKCNLYLMGMKSILFFKNYNYANIQQVINLDDNITYEMLYPVTKKIINSFNNNHCDKLFIIGNNNTLNKVKPYVLQLLPLASNFFTDIGYTKYNQWDYLYEPESMLAIDFILQRYVLFQIFQLILENIVCEQFCRMVIMKTATENSENIIQELQLLYNKIRQYSITQEIIEIISGSSTDIN